MAWLSGFTKRLKITIPSDNVDSTLTDFPILLKLSTDCGLTGFDASIVFDELELDANRFKIAVTASDGTTQRYVEIEKWDDSSEIAWLWVKVSSVAASGKTELYFYYDSTASDNTTYVGDIGDTPAQNVWSNNFWAVFHMGDTSSPFLDSTTTSGTALNVSGGTPTYATPAKVAEGVDWGSSQVAGQGITGFTASNVTVENWVKQDSASTAVRRYVTLSSEIACLRQDSGGTGQFKWFIKTGGVIRSMTSNNQVDTNWAYWAGTWDGTTQRMYKDASEIGTPNVPGGTLNTGVGMSINSGSENFTGLQDEIRVSTVARPESWLKATYYTCNDNLLYMEEDVTEAAWLGSWGQRIKLTIDKDKVDENIIDFPALITLASGVGLTGADVTPVFDELDYAFTPNDTFSGTNGDPPDPTKWLDGGGAGTGQIQSNKLRLSVGSGSTQSKQYYSTYKLQGDFDVQVDYDIILGPSTANWFFSLNINTDEPSFVNKHRAILYREYAASAQRFEWQTFDGSYHTEANPTNSATSGKLRLTRVGSTWTAYYDVGGGWVSLGASAFLNKTGPVFVRLRLENYTPNDPAVTFDLDNFIVNNGTVIWGNEEDYVSSFPNRKKIAITTANGTTQCYAEINRWEQHNELASIWTKVPVISSTEDTILYLYYDSSQADNSTYVGDVAETAGRNVWDLNFVMVHHMERWPTYNQLDSTQNATNTTASNSFEDTDQVDGLIGKAISGDGVNESFDLPTTGILEVSPFTVEVFIQKDTQGSGVSLVAYQPKGANAEGRGWLLRCNSDIPGFLKGSGDGSWESVNATTDIANSEYHHLAVRFEADTLFDILINGTIEDNETNPSELTDVTYADSGSSSNPPTKQARIFCGVDEPGADSGFADGKIDEIRISNTVRSVSWVKATNYTARDNFITYTAPETEPAPSVGTFNGYVQLAGENVARIVTLYRRSTGELQDYTTSNPNTGYFELETPYDELHYLVILPDIDDGYQPIARDQIDPV